MCGGQGWHIYDKRVHNVPVLHVNAWYQRSKRHLSQEKTRGQHWYKRQVFLCPPVWRLNESHSPLGLSDKLCTGLKLEEPYLLTTTCLRKYVATVSQVLDLQEKELDWLARHMGHDVRVHREYYRLHESTLELAKVSKILALVDCLRKQCTGLKLALVELSHWEISNYWHWRSGWQEWGKHQSSHWEISNWHWCSGWQKWANLEGSSWPTKKICFQSHTLYRIGVSCQYKTTTFTFELLIY